MQSGSGGANPGLLQSGERLLAQLDTDVQKLTQAVNRIAQILESAAATPVSGSRGGNVALANLLTALAGLGIITDNTTP